MIGSIFPFPFQSKTAKSTIRIAKIHTAKCGTGLLSFTSLAPRRMWTGSVCDEWDDTAVLLHAKDIVLLRSTKN